MSKITIIGTGNVGATIAYSIALTGVASEIVMVDINTERAKAESMDIKQGMPCFHGVNIYQADYPATAGSDIVVFTSGVGRKPGQTRLELAQVNVNICKSVIPLITEYCPDAYYVIVANPVDILTYVFCKLGGIPENKIIGTGTLLDTARLRDKLCELYNVDATNVHASVLGEHGDSSFVAWSLANIANVRIDDCAKAFGTDTVLDRDEVETHVRKSGGYIIERKGVTNYAIAAVTTRLVKAIMSDVDSILPVSTMMHGEYGISDVCLSTPTIVGKNPRKVNVDLTEEEIAKLQYSAECLKKVIDSVEI